MTDGAARVAGTDTLAGRFAYNKYVAYNCFLLFSSFVWINIPTADWRRFVLVLLITDVNFM